MMQHFVMAMGAALAAASGVAFETTGITDARAKIAAACGTSPEIVVGWEDFNKDVDARTGLVEGGLAFLTGAFEAVCKDAGLKGEVGKQISKVRLMQAYGAADPVIYLSRGTLHVEYLWAKGQPAPDVAYVRDEIASRLRGEEAEAP